MTEEHYVTALDGDAVEEQELDPSIYVQDLEDAISLASHYETIPNHFRQDIALPAGWKLPLFFKRLLDQTMLSAVPQMCFGNESKCAARCPLQNPEEFRNKKCPLETYRLATTFQGIIEEFDIDLRSTSEIQLARQISISTVTALRAELMVSTDNLVEDVAGIIQGANSEVIYHNVPDPQLTIAQRAVEESQKCLGLLLQRRTMKANMELKQAQLHLKMREVDLQERKQKFLEERDIIDSNYDPISDIENRLAASKAKIQRSQVE